MSNHPDIFIPIHKFNVYYIFFPALKKGIQFCLYPIHPTGKNFNKKK